MRSIRLIRIGLGAALAAAAGPLSSASASEVCDALRNALADPAPHEPAGSQAFVDPSREPLLGELRDLEGRAEALGCSRGSIIMVDGPNSAACSRVTSLILDVRSRLDEADQDATVANPAASARARADIARQMRIEGCADAPPPILGVSQFSDPGSAGISSLSPMDRSPLMVRPPSPGKEPLFEQPAPDATPSIMQVPEPPKGRIPDLSEALSNAEPGIDRLPPALHSKARPMTERERNVRHVGPRFFPDPDDGLRLGSKDK
ncbi:MAG: hypothetical protein ACTHJ3_06640 [Pararhizobium sp.]